MKDYINAYKNILNFNGSTSLKEFWNFFFINLAVNVLVKIIVKKTDIPYLIEDIYIAIVLIVFISIGFRRLKNAGGFPMAFLIPILNLFLAMLPEKKYKS